MRVEVKQLSIIITTHCTLNCKCCASRIADYRNRGLACHSPLDQLKREVDELFKVYDYIENLTVSGGEPLMHPNVFEVCEYILGFSEKFGDCRVFSNGTIVPNQKLIDLMIQNPVKLKLVIDDYGPNTSKKLPEIRQIWEKIGLELRAIKYWGDEPHCGGWINYGDSSKDLGRSYEELCTLISRCHAAQYSCPQTLNGELTTCSFSGMGADLGYFQFGSITSPNKGFVDLFDESIPLSEKRNIASTLASEPLIACRYCNGFDIERSPRIRAGEQI